MARRYRRRSYRLGQTEGDAAPVADAGGKKQPLPFLTPKVGNVMISLGVLSAVGAVSYYVFKGNDIMNLWGELFPKAQSNIPRGSADAGAFIQVSPADKYARSVLAPVTGPVISRDIRVQSPSDLYSRSALRR